MSAHLQQSLVGLHYSVLIECQEVQPQALYAHLRLKNFMPAVLYT